jgi:hypothetical protein
MISSYVYSSVILLSDPKSRHGRKYILSKTACQTFIPGQNAILRTS